MQVPTEENEGNEGIYGGSRIFLQSSSVPRNILAGEVLEAEFSGGLWAGVVN